MMEPSDDNRSWTFFTNHAHVLFCLANDSDVRLRDVATRVGITERAVQRIVSDLSEGGYITIERNGRRNHYRVHDGVRLRHPIEHHCTIGRIVRDVLKEEA